MKIAIVEKEHFEGAFPVIKLFDSPGNEITIYTSEQTQGRFNDLFLDKSSRYQWVVLPTAGKFRFFYSLYKNLRKQKPDILYINTISDNHLLYAFVLWLLQLKRIVLTVHDINCLFESRSGWNPRGTIIHRGKKWLTWLVHEFNTVADTMTPYLQTKVKPRKTHVVPGAVYENRQLKQTISDEIRIVVPGSLDKRRRDYEQVFEFAESANKEKLRVRLILLGGYSDDYGLKIIERANKFQSSFCKLFAYDTQTVNQDEFDRQLDATHFIFIPSVINTKICGDIPEIYGITKSSGNIFDVIKHAKPFIAPEGLTIPPNLQTSCFKYSNISDVTSFLSGLILSPADYENWQNKALENSANYTIEKVRARNALLFEEPRT